MLEIEEIFCLNLQKNLKKPGGCSQISGNFDNFCLYYRICFRM